MNLMSGLLGLSSFADAYARAGDKAELINMQRQEQDRLRQREERAQLQDMNNAQSIMQYLDPMKAAESSGMGNRDVARRQSLPSADIQLQLFKVKQERDAMEAEKRTKGLQSLASLWYANGGEKADPGGANFQRRFGVSPYEYVPQGVITSMANLDMRRDLADESRQTRLAIANMGRGGGKNLPKPPVGYRYAMDENSGEMMLEPIPGGPTATKRDGLAATKARQADLLSEDIDRAIAMAKDYSVIPNTGFGAALSVIPGTTAHDLSQMLDGIKARIGFDALQEMRNNSPTGGALGSVSDTEGKKLDSIYGSLSQSQSEEEFIYNLKRLKSAYNDVVHGSGNWRDESGRVVVGAPTTSSVRGKVQRVGPQVGEVRGGYRFKGGNPADENSWEAVNGQ